MRKVVFDFESKEIDVLPKYPPKPVGLAIMVDGEPLKGVLDSNPWYFAWGHPSENNCNEAQVKKAVQELALADDTIWIAHNLAFDAAILNKHWDVQLPWGKRTVCTMLLTFLSNPYGQLSLKPLMAMKPFNMPAEEQDSVQDWLVRHGVVRANDKQWGAQISMAPGGLVGHYAHGDILRCGKLAEHYGAGGAAPDGSVVKHRRDTTTLDFT